MNLSNIYKKRHDDLLFRQAMWKIFIENFFQSYISEKDVVLDIACGYCTFINQISCAKKYAVDTNPDSKKYVSPDVIFFRESSVKIKSIKSGQIDVIFISNFFEHIERPQISATVREIRRLLKPGGKVLILQPNIRFLQKDYWRFFDHITPIDDRAIQEIFESYHFKLEEKILKFLPFTAVGSIRSLLLCKLYIKIPILWKFFGRQSFLVLKKIN